jgi:hypothetical protein
MSTTAIAAYNQLVPQQRDYNKAIDEALNAIVAILESKLHLAEQQKQLQAEIGISYPEHSPADVRRHVIDVIVRRLEQRDTTGTTDWSCRVAQPGGNLA